MKRRIYAAARRYLYTVGLVSGALGLRLSLSPFLGKHFRYHLFYITSAIIATLWGVGPSLLGTALSIIFITYFLIPPYRSLSVELPIDVSGLLGFLFASFVLTGLSSAKQAAERLRAERALRESAEVLKTADQRKDEFIATLAHELRNPLAPIVSALEVLKVTRSEGPDAKEAQGVIERQVRQLVRLVDDLLDIARITQGKLTLQREPVDLAAVIAGAIEASRPSIERCRHSLEVTPSCRRLIVDGDATRLIQVVTNLLNNAARYTVKPGHIWLSCEAQGQEAVIRVRDDGIGVAAEDMKKLFRRFTQLKPTLKRTEGGLGIGLSLVKGLVSLHDGSCEARSDGLGKGAEFVVRLPLSAAQEIAARPKADESIAAAPKRRVLIVDDNYDAAESMGLFLKMVGCEIQIAPDGESGIEIAGAFRPELVLLDIGLPQMNGYEVAARIRAESWGRNMVLVALTGWGQGTDKMLATEAGFDQHITKPADPAMLVKWMLSWRSRDEAIASAL